MADVVMARRVGVAGGGEEAAVVVLATDVRFTLVGTAVALAADCTTLATGAALVVTA